MFHTRKPDLGEPLFPEEQKFSKVDLSTKQQLESTSRLQVSAKSHDTGVAELRSTIIQMHGLQVVIKKLRAPMSSGNPPVSHEEIGEVCDHDCPAPRHTANSSSWATSGRSGCVRFLRVTQFRFGVCISPEATNADIPIRNALTRRF